MSFSSAGVQASAPLGIFDSGLGGLSVLRAVRAALPDERIIYVADTQYAPYGERDDDFIVDRTLAIGNWLVSQGAKALVVACNTATAQSIAMAREKLPIPLVGNLVHDIVDRTRRRSICRPGSLAMAPS